MHVEANPYSGGINFRKKGEKRRSRGNNVHSWFVRRLSTVLAHRVLLLIATQAETQLKLSENALKVVHELYVDAR